MPAITSANVANAIVKLVAVDALPALMSNLVMGNLVNRDYESALAKAGDTINVPIPATLVANSVGEGASVVTQNPNLGNAQIVLNTHAEATFQIPDVTKVLAAPDLMALYMQPAVIALAEKIESDLLALYPTFTFNAAVGAVNTNITEAVTDQAEQALFDAKVPATEQRYMVVTSKDYSAMRQLPRFSELQTAAAGLQGNMNVIQTGTLGKIKDFFVFRSQLIPKTGNPVNSHNLAFTKNAIGLVIRRLPQPLPGTGAIAEYAEMGSFGLRVVMSYQPNTLAQQFTVDVLYGAGRLRNEFAVQINS